MSARILAFKHPEPGPDQPAARLVSRPADQAMDADRSPGLGSSPTGRRAMAVGTRAAGIEGPSLETLLAGVARDDRGAFRELYRRAAPALLAAAQAITRDRAAAEDVLQDAFMRIVERAALFDPAKGSAMSWLIVVTRRVALNDLRSRKRAPVGADDVGVDLDAIVDDRAAPDPIAARRLSQCLARLSEDHRTAVVLAYVEGLTHEELAERLGRPLGTVKAWVKRGLDHLKECTG